MKKLTVKQLFDVKKKDFVLSMVSNPITLDKQISNPIINRPQLALTGYFERFHYDRIQLLGETEILYLNSLSENDRQKILQEMMQRDIPCFIISKGLSVPWQMEFLANEMNIGLLVSKLSTEKLFWHLSKFLRDSYSQSLTMHATLVQVHGVGILLTGKSGIGKSECALELIERGHNIISDDVTLIQSDETVLIGKSPRSYECYMEVRGVGVIDVERMFGVQSIRKETKIDIQVEMMGWHENMDVERIGIGNEMTELLGIKIPVVNIPVSPGKNIAVIIEVIAINTILKHFGYDAAKARTERLTDELQHKYLKL